MKEFFMNKFFNLCIGIVIFIISISTLYSFNEKQFMSTQKNKDAVVTLLEEVWSKGNFQIVDQLIIFLMGK